MAKLIFFVCLLNSTFAAACDTQEAQFIGQVKNHIEHQRSESVTECTFEIEFSMYYSSSVCPLDAIDLKGYQFQDPTCVQRENDLISGVIARRGSFFVIE